MIHRNDDRHQPLETFAMYYALSMAFQQTILDI
jgi:hypothetical protein